MKLTSFSTATAPEHRAKGTVAKFKSHVIWGTREGSELIRGSSTSGSRGKDPGHEVRGSWFSLYRA